MFEKLKTAYLSACVRISNIAATAKSAMLAASVFMYTSIVCASPAFATGAAGAIQDGISSGAKSIYDIITSIVLPIAAVALAICAFKILFGNTRDAESAKNMALKIVIVIAVVYLAPVIISQVGGWFKGKGDNSGIW